MKKIILLLLTLLNLAYVFFTMVSSDNVDSLFLVPFGFPLLTTVVLFCLGAISLAYEEHIKYTKTLSFIIMGLNLLPILHVILLFVFL